VAQIVHRSQHENASTGKIRFRVGLLQADEQRRVRKKHGKREKEAQYTVYSVKLKKLLTKRQLEQFIIVSEDIVLVDRIIVRRLC